MVYVDRLEVKGMLTSQCTQDVQQDDRVNSPRQSENQTRMRGNVAGKTIRHNTGDRLI